MYSGREGKLPVSILIEPSKKKAKKIEKRVGKGDKGFVRDRSLSTFRDVDVWFFQPMVVRDSKGYLRDNYSSPYSKVYGDID